MLCVQYMQLRSVTKLTSAALLLEFLFLAAAFAHDGHSNMEEDMDKIGPSPSAGLSRPAASVSPNAVQTNHPSYFGYSAGSGFIYAHAFFMVLGWMFLLPVGVMLSIAKSNIRTPVQALFLAINVLGVVLGAIYNAKTPDLYPQNSHHKLGWVLTWLVGIYILMGLLSNYSERDRGYDKTSAEGLPFLPVSVEAMEAYQKAHGEEAEHRRHSNDSGQGTERASSSLRSHSLSPTDEYGDQRLPSYGRIYSDGEDATTHGRRLFLRSNVLDRIVRQVLGLPKGVLRLTEMLYTTVDRVILILGFIAICTGAVTYGGIMRGDGIFNGLAHFIKGGIFLWYGVLTLGRWMGCFADLGWAWNIKPSPVAGSWKTSIPSAEFVESFVIFLYGTTNVFLEHLAAWGDAWTAQDLEHVSISVMFFGGGLTKDIVKAIEAYQLDAMFVFTLTVGLTAFFMAWIIMVVAVKGWAVRRAQTIF
ncbi:hypothetical protein FGG08_001776 [Glutinoglossum americanum]|uniref:Integral membrane protein n=1 Tax=Glutinoglossum americanum TaxID=1670608 RepID=A0A9P8L626_9PEZI|nr:hypothetical protein FGG08_001776 [Glutinoglossum americanum]